MTVHFICRGNVLRSIIAEAYLRSLHIANLEVLSSGTVAATHRQMNQPNYLHTVELLRGHGLQDYIKPTYADQLIQECLAGADVAICMNKIVLDECQDLGINLPPKTLVWDVTDVGEPGREIDDANTRETYGEIVFTEIVELVDALVISEGWR